MVVPGETGADWLDSGQCRDCFQPAFNYRPKNSVQYIEALTNFDEPEGPKRFRFGFIASSDNHSARPGTGYKEYARNDMTEQRGARSPDQARLVAGEPEAPTLEPRRFDPSTIQGMGAFRIAETERQNSFWLTGGLVAVHAEGRTRDGVWNALQKKETYGTSGPRILLWFDLVNPPAAEGRLPMGSEVAMSEGPRFEVRAVGSFEQKPGCPEFSTSALTPERIEYLCKGECYHPSDQRRLITRIEVVRDPPAAREGRAAGAADRGSVEDLPLPGRPRRLPGQLRRPRLRDGRARRRLLRARDRGEEPGGQRGQPALHVRRGGQLRVDESVLGRLAHGGTPTRASARPRSAPGLRPSIVDWQAPAPMPADEAEAMGG